MEKDIILYWKSMENYSHIAIRTLAILSIFAQFVGEGSAVTRIMRP